MDTKTQAQAIRYADNNLRDAGLPTYSELLARRLALMTDEGDDQIKGAAYIDKAGVIRAKGSLLETIEQARAAMYRAGGAA